MLLLNMSPSYFCCRFCISHENNGKKINKSKSRNKPTCTVAGDGNQASWCCRHDSNKDNVRSHTKWRSFEVHVCNAWTCATKSEKIYWYQQLAAFVLWCGGPPLLYQKHPPTMTLHVMAFLSNRGNDFQVL